MANDLKGTFEQIIQTKMYTQILSDANALSQISACAGLINASPEAYFKGKVNYYGVPSKNIPSRQWLAAGTGINATVSQGRYQYLREFKDIVEKHLSNPRQVTASYKIVDGRVLNTMPALSSTIMVGPKRIMEEIAQSMVDNMAAYIATGNHIPNKPSTVRIKGFNHALFWTGELLSSIKGEVIDGREKDRSRSSRGDIIDTI